MRTTVTIDADTQHLLEEEINRSGHSFKVVLNEAIRTALSKKQTKPIVVNPLFNGPFPAEFEGISANQVADLLDDEDTLRELSR